ncbi:MAG: heme exporter protein CcmD [Pelagibacterium sp. SCN 63-23]|nr:MAG: heme exporter protein CcmD [Pelagibacterium sp. SCN 63-23]
MIELGQHATFIIIAYAGVFLGAALLALWILLDSRRTSARLAALTDKNGR